MVSGAFTTDDVIKMRSGSLLRFSAFNGTDFAGSIQALSPTEGFKIYVQAAVTFRYVSLAAVSLTAGSGSPPEIRRRANINAGCQPKFVISDGLGVMADDATMTPAIVHLDGVGIGFPFDGSSSEDTCDQLVAIGVADGLVRGTSYAIRNGFSLGMIGTAGELIEFRYWNAAEEQVHSFTAPPPTPSCHA